MPWFDILSYPQCLVKGSWSLRRVDLTIVLQVFCTGRNKQKLQELGLPFHDADLTDEGACQAVVESAVKSLGGLTTLVRFHTIDILIIQAVMLIVSG
jgi:hypothetical protein